jgi:hypothetical protein
MEIPEMDQSSTTVGLERPDDKLPSSIPIIDPVTEEQFGEIEDAGAAGVDGFDPANGHLHKKGRAAARPEI